MTDLINIEELVQSHDRYLSQIKEHPYRKMLQSELSHRRYNGIRFLEPEPDDMFLYVLGFRDDAFSKKLFGLEKFEISFSPCKDLPDYDNIKELANSCGISLGGYGCSKTPMYNVYTHHFNFFRHNFFSDNAKHRKCLASLHDSFFLQ